MTMQNSLDPARITEPVAHDYVDGMSDTETPAKRSRRQPITSANARELALKGAEAKRRGRQARERLAEVLHGPDPEAALNQFWKAVDQAYEKPTEHVEVRAGPMPPEELRTWSDERIDARLKELDRGPWRPPWGP